MRVGLRASVGVAALLLVGCDAPGEPSRPRIANADPARGLLLISQYGCTTCHRIGGVRGWHGMVGPPIIDWAQRTTLAGHYPNTPPNLIAWLLNPPALRPGTAMPKLGIEAAEARDIAAYLYTLGAESVQVYPPEPPLARSDTFVPTIERIERQTSPLARGAARP